MATFNELVADVITITNRPDLLAETKLAIKAATLKIHQSDYYYKDLHETGIAFSSAAFAQQLDYRVLLPRYRSLKYLRKSDSTGAPGNFIEVLTPSEVLDAYGIAKDNICYVAGEVIQIKSSTEFQYAILGVYLNPNIVEADYSSWVALDHPFAIVYEAALTVFKAIGYDEQATTFTRMAGEQLQYVKSSNILAEGY